MITRDADFSQSEVLTDLRENGSERPWSLKKVANEYLARVYKGLNDAKALRLSLCASVLTFYKTEEGKQKLMRGNFCRVRLCPVCQWRRALKLQGQMMRILKHLEPNGYEYVFLTLTVKNVPARALSAALNNMAEGWNRLTKYADFKAAVAGAYRGCEITKNHKTGEYHPHYHCILAVPRRYFSGGYYIKHAKWAELWARAVGADYLPNVDVRKIKGNTAQAVAETCKYTVKESDFLQGKEELDRKTVEILDEALDRRRLVSLTGVFRKAHRALNLTDYDDPNLQDEEEKATADTVSYVWVTGYRNYYKK